MKLLLVDNYDSFTWNLVQLLGALGAEPEVRRNDALSVADAVAPGWAGIVISPGPCTPAEAGISVPLARAAADHAIPLLGVCLGHQALAAAFGATIERAPTLMHGKTCQVAHDGEGLFAGLASPLDVMRYHSLAIRNGTLPGAFRVSATAQDGDDPTIMAIQHQSLPLYGVQFHPESVGTPAGSRMLANFLATAASRSG